jgi:hypothetical protein
MPTTNKQTLLIIGRFRNNPFHVGQCDRLTSIALQIVGQCVRTYVIASGIRQEHENGSTKVDAVEFLVVVQERYDRLEHTPVHFVHFVEYKQRSLTLGCVAANPLLQLILCAQQIP